MLQVVPFIWDTELISLALAIGKLIAKAALSIVAFMGFKGVSLKRLAVVAFRAWGYGVGTIVTMEAITSNLEGALTLEFISEQAGNWEPFVFSHLQGSAEAKLYLHLLNAWAY